MRFRAVISRPSGKRRSIFLIGGVVNSFFSTSLSSTVDGELLILLVWLSASNRASACWLRYGNEHTSSASGSPGQSSGRHPQSLRKRVSSCTTTDKEGASSFTTTNTEGASIPRSSIRNTPLTVLLVLRCLGLLSLGEAGASSMAESTLLKVACSCTSAAIVSCDGRTRR